MSEFKPYRDESRKDWGTKQDGKLTLEQINTGALLRIADATEAMAKEYNRLIGENEYLQKRHRNQLAELERLRNQNRGLRGAITRLKNMAKHDDVPDA